MDGVTTPVEVWAPAFSWEKEERLFTVDRLLNLQRGSGFYCLLCEGTVPTGERARHVKAHQRELRAFKKGEIARFRREATAVIREVNRLKAEERRVLG